VPIIALSHLAQPPVKADLHHKQIRKQRAPTSKHMILRPLVFWLSESPMGPVRPREPDPTASTTTGTAALREPPRQSV
jgi:hypothetical protein